LPLPQEHKGKKFAVYLRRSEGEKGDTQAQYDRIKKRLADMVKSKEIQPINESIIGRDITGKQKFNKERDLCDDCIGDIFNEGNGQSGFKFEERPVFIEMLRRVRNGMYDGIIVESMDRIARDFAGLSHLALPLWRNDGKIIYALNSSQTLDKDRTNEAIINSQMTWGGIGKQEEIKKARTALKGKILQGYLAGSNPQFLGDKSKAGDTGVDYRKLWEIAQATGENENGNLDNSSAIGKMFKRDNKWANSYYQRMKNMEELGVLEEWLSNVEAVNEWMRVNGGDYPRRFYNTKKARTLFDRTRGYFGYPAGVNLAGTNTFVTFSSPISIGLDELSEMKNLPDDYVLEESITSGEKLDLNIIQTQPRARGGL